MERIEADILVGLRNPETFEFTMRVHNDEQTLVGPQPHRQLHLISFSVSQSVIFWIVLSRKIAQNCEKQL